MATVEDIVGRLGRQHSTAAVLFHHAVAEHLGLGPTDHKCFDLLRERGTMTASALVAITGLTSGAITGVVARLERAGYLRRQPDPEDGRQQILIPYAARVQEIQRVFEPVRNDLARLLEGFDERQLNAIAEFLGGSIALIYRHIALMRGGALEERAHERRPSPHAVERGKGTHGKSKPGAGASTAKRGGARHLIKKRTG